jgi:hypothetical protein
MNARCEAYRSYALLSEKLARAASDPLGRLEWEQTAIDWHRLANLAAQSDGDDSHELVK